MDLNSQYSQSHLTNHYSSTLLIFINIKRYLTEREKKLRLRRKHAEEIIAWKKKLDDEELQVREIEKKGICCYLFVLN